MMGYLAAQNKSDAEYYKRRKSCANGRSGMLADALQRSNEV